MPGSPARGRSGRLRSGVQAAFEVPLAFLLDPGNHRLVTRHVADLTLEFFEITYQRWHIWGATAAILVALQECLQEKISGKFDV